MPKSLYFFIATIVIFILQVIPLTGIFLLFAQAPFWSVLLINFGFMGIALEVSAGKVARVWLALPVLWFGGYAGYAAFEHITLRKLRADVAVANEQISIPFDPSRMSLVFAERQNDGKLLSDFRLAILYVENDSYSGAKHRSYRLINIGICSGIREAHPLNHAISTLVIRKEKPTWAGDFDKNHCLLTLPEDPRFPVARIQHERSKDIANIAFMPIHMTDTIVQMPDGTHHTLKNGTARPVSWLPMPVIGCTLISRDASWKCFAEFWRNHRRLQNSDASILAKALGLHPTSPEQRRATEDSEAVELIETAKERVIAAETGNLDRALDDVTVDIGSLPFQNLRGNIDIVLSRLDRIVSAIEQGSALKRHAYANAQQLFRLIESMPAADLEAYKPRLTALGNRDQWFGSQVAKMGFAR